MFRCQITGKLSRQGDPRTGELTYLSEKSEMDTRAPEKLNRIVVQTREREYTKKVRNEETGRWEDVVIGRGWEIVRELNATDEGVAEWNAMSEEERANFLVNLDS
jgi:hypothetical protein